MMSPKATQLMDDKSEEIRLMEPDRAAQADKISDRVMKRTAEFKIFVDNRRDE